ncbi:MAG: hypothetical protein B193_2091 [Solidesulfovibrio magneticus str. Maddingley MBC34]|uniref:Uncharacterized protein n=1 Tax=Solidesulfovibrio magneticus str. Maddingley MBC34 TaxID=1206767 RepID=K6H9P4_9BACT|nr:MAG: hypothetical protein B193_2091 [Solidesulfovibrio magneticus str. Maddingley MBC34]
MRQAVFWCLRFYIVPIEYELFQKNVSDQEKLNLFKQFFLKNGNYSFGKEEVYAIRITHIEGDMHFGKLSKREYTENRSITPVDVEDSVIEDWPYVNFVFDVSKGVQLLAIEKDMELFPSVSGLKRKMSLMAKKSMGYTGFVVNFEPVVEKFAFWNIIEQAERIYALRLKLESPNMFGASMKARESLKELQGVFNNNKLGIVIENSEGNLDIPRERIESYVEYADQGGGSWVLDIARDGERRRFASFQNAVVAKVALIKSDPLGMMRNAMGYFKKFL